MKPGTHIPRALVRACLALFTLAVFSPAQADGPPQRVIVKYITLESPEAASAATQIIADVSSRFGVSLNVVGGTATGAQVLALDRTLTPADLRALVAALASSPGVEYAEEDLLLRAFFTPNDPRYNEQWHYFESTAGLNLPPAWDSSTGTGVTVGVIDTGYRPHADLAANIVGGYDFISDRFVSRDGDGRDSDARDPGDWTLANDCELGWLPTSSSWHGTHVAGTVAARTSNSTGVAGVAFNARVLPLRVLGRCGGYTSDIADAIIWASGGSVSGVPANANTAQVLNLSLGGSGACGVTMQSAINSARSRGTIVIVSAGNSNANASNTSPANCSGVVTVAAVNRNGGRAFYSNFGSVVDVAAPGGDTRASDANGVLSTLNTGSTTPGNDTYAFYQGTSMAAPHVAGVAALMAAVNGTLTPGEIETHLRNTARAFPGSCSQCGTGIVNAAAAVAAASGPPPSSCPAGFTQHDGTLSGTGASVRLPSNAGYVTSVSGLHSGRLTGPSNADFDLRLYRRSSGSWRIVARSEGPTSTESIDFNGSSGKYRWRVRSFSGSGQFTLCERHP